MNISLNFVLNRNKTSLSHFIKKNKLTTYDLLLEYCQRRKFVPCSEEEYNNEKPAGFHTSIESKKTPEVQNEQKVNRKASKAPKPKKRRYRRKKQQDTP